MVTFEVGDKVRQITEIGPGCIGDVFTVRRVDSEYVGVDSESERHLGGYYSFRFEMVVGPEPELSQVWQDKIEAALGRDALITLGVVAAPEPKFKVGDRVALVHSPQGVKGTVVEVDPERVRVHWDNFLTLRYPEKFLRPVEVVKTRKTGIQVQVHIEGGSLAEARAQDAALFVERALDGYTIRGKVTTDIYTYTETTEA